MKKGWMAAALTATMALSLTACGGSGEEKKAEGGKKEADKELTVWVEKVFSDDANTAMQERLDAFAEESGIKVKYEFIGATDFMTKLNAAIEAGSNVPDITTSAVTKVVNYYPNIPYKDVSDIVSNINEERPYFEAVYEGTKIDGKHYFVPMTSSSTMMFVRKDKLEEKGITELPKTWDEVFEVAEQISDPDNGFYGLGIGCGPTDEDGENMFRMINWDQGGYIFDKDGNITLDNDVTKSLLTKYKEMYDGGVIPKAASTWDPGGNNSAYLMGECGIVFNAPTLYNALRSDEANKELFENTEMVSLLAGSDNDTTMGFATGFAIMETCDDVESATKLIEYMYDKEWYEEYLEITAPVFAPLFQDMEGEGVWADGVNAQIIDYAKKAKGYYGYPVEGIKGRAIAAKHYFTFPMAEMMNKVVTDTLDVDGAIGDAIKKLEAVQKTVK